MFNLFKISTLNLHLRHIANNYKSISKQGQHIVPRVYLQYFSTASFVYIINYVDPYRKNQIHRIGIKHKLFTKNNYYDFNSKYLEERFSQFESKYNTIMNRLQSRTFLNIETKHWILAWMHMSKTRSEFFRDNIARIFSNTEKFSYGYKHGGEEMRKRNNEFVKNGQKGGKIFQLESFLTGEYDKALNDYGMNFLKREWIVYYSTDKEFITNDNPGFSVTINRQNQLLNMSPFGSDYNLNEEGYVAHYFPLSKNMCLFLKPYCWDNNTSEEKIKKDIMSDIRFTDANEEIINDINKVTQMTRHKMIVANAADSLRIYISK